MFTRYQGINLPKNYGGSLFYDGEIEEDTKTKHHKPNIYGASKSALSPSFNNVSSENSYKSNEVEHLKEDTFDKSEFSPNPVDVFYSNNPENDADNSENESFSYNCCSNDEDLPYENGNETLYDENSYNGSAIYGKTNSYETDNQSEIAKKCEKENCEKSNGHSFKIGDLLSNVDSDEILILAIILLISSEGKCENNDVLPILALLILSRKR